MAPAPYFAAAMVSAALVALVCGQAVAEPTSAPPSLPSCPLGQVSRKVQGPTPKPVVSRRKLRWERQYGGKEAAKAHVVARLSGRPSVFLLEKSALPEEGQELAWRLARDTWRGLRALTDKHNGLPVDHVRLTPSNDGPPHLQVGDYTNVTNIGLYLMAIVAARDLKLVAPQEALGLVQGLLQTLDTLERRRGVFFNYYDTTSLERTSNFLSFVDSAWLTAGLIVTRQAFPELAERVSAVIEQTDYGVFYDRKTRRIAHGYFVDPFVRSPYDYSLLYTEARLGSLLAIGKGDVGRKHWFSLWRVLPAGCDWQSLPPQGAQLRQVDDVVVQVGYQEWKGERFVASWGGSMFEALMPSLVLDETRFAPASLGWNGIQHAVVQRRYATEELGYRVWGMSPSRRPVGDGYSEYGVPVLGVRGYAAGAVAPYAAALALAVTPEPALADLQALARGFDAYGEYGFYDAVDPSTGAVAYTYLTLDQLMLFVALANYLEPHCIQNHFAGDAIVQRFLPLLQVEDTLWPPARQETHGQR